VRKGPNATYQRIDRTAVDAFVEGLLDSLAYLGDQRLAMLEKVESTMLQYLIDTRTIPRSRGQRERDSSLERLLVRNGYNPLSQTRSPTSQKVPSPKLIETLAQTGHRPVSGAVSKPRASRGSGKVDWILYEAILYAVTKTLDDQLGVQGQHILDRIGTSMLDYLVKQGVIKRSDDPDVLVQRVIDYFVSAGYAKSFRYELEGAPPDTFVSRYESARYYTNVFRRTQKEGSALLSCPLCLIGHSIYATVGWRFGNVFEVRISSGGNVLSRARIYPPTERFTEKDAQIFSRIKVQDPPK